ncbi:MAG: UDP-N-acetylmuramoyl-tripeptide--D-alanyl-D-alanine ligase [Opitutales bacterium]|nr:UDP-N-acetylmuramoyl-tripeptide--D-alanyl-D-alanine ligase [Opitutales bacterium]
MENVLNGAFVEKTLGAKWRGGNVPGKIAGAAIDTRKILPGEIFVAIKTANRDGHDFLETARERGAAGALVSRFVPEVALPQIVVPDTVAALQKLAAVHRIENFRVGKTVFGVTGSVGKTSTKDLLALILSQEAPTLATEKNLNNTLGVPLTLLKINPEVHRFAVVEAGMSVPGELGVSAQMIFPDVALVTNVKPAHLEGLGTMENIAREKASLAADVHDGSVIFNADLLQYESFRKIRAALADVLSRNAEEAALTESWKQSDEFEIAYFADSVACEILDAGNNVFYLKIQATHEKEGVFTVRNISRGLAENAALAIQAASEFVSPEKIQAALDAWKPSANRGEVRERACGGKIFVDCYNASPASMLDSADAFATRFAGTPEMPRLFVLGGMGELGETSEPLHREVGEKLPLCAETDFLALFGGNAAQIGQGAVAAGFPRERVHMFDDIVELREFIAAFRGNVMLKGSRTFALERAIPA